MNVLSQTCITFSLYLATVEGRPLRYKEHKWVAPGGGAAREGEAARKMEKASEV